MEIKDILAELDHEIERLQQARSLLAGTTAQKKTSAKKAAIVTAPKKRKLTPEGRKRIAEAMKRRWAERKKAASRSSK